MLSDVSTAANPYNALSIIVSFRVARADSVRVVYDGWGERDAATPFFAVRDGPARIAVVGLRPNTPYTLHLEAAGAGGAVSHADVGAATGELPPVLRSVHLKITGVLSPGFLLTVPEFFDRGANGYVLIFDEAGALRWYREFDGEGWAVEAKQQLNGDITVYLGRSYGYQPVSGRFAEIRPSGEEVRSFSVSSPSYTDPHELILGFRDTTLDRVHLLGYDVRPMNLTSIGGSPIAPVAVHFIERKSASGITEFRWSAADHYSPSDWPVADPSLPDLDHPSSLAIGADGNYVVSLQALDEVAAIDARTGAFLWRMGGRNNQFAIVNDPLAGFQGQHHAQLLGTDHLLLLDDRPRASPPGARAVEYALDVPGRVARMVWEYRPDPPVISQIMGSVQRLRTGNTLVGFALAGRIDEVDPGGAKIAEADLVGGDDVRVQFYRVLRIGSLYRSEMP